MNKLEILLSCMHQDNLGIVQRSKITSDVLIVNQCDKDEKIEECSTDKTIRMISTSTRGLSLSRNIAIDNAVGNICLICDDDEVFDEKYEENILDSFKKYTQADVLAFIVTTPPEAYNHKKYKLYPFKISYMQALKVTSYQIAFKLDAIRRNGIRFDETVGSGVSAAGGEEKIFLHDCLKAGLKIYFIPIRIGQAAQDVSQWVGKLFSPEYFEDRGRFTKKLYGGKPFAIVYAFFFAVMKYPKYKNKTSFTQALLLMLKGVYSRA